MKTSYFLLFLSFYGFITGAMMLFDGAGSLQSYGVQHIDKDHISTIQFLGLTNIGFGLHTFLFRNANTANARNILITTAFLTIGCVLKGCYDVFGQGMVANDFFRVDMAFRLLVGFVAVYFAFKNAKIA